MSEPPRQPDGDGDAEWVDIVPATGDRRAFHEQLRAWNRKHPYVDPKDQRIHMACGGDPSPVWWAQVHRQALRPEDR